MNPTLSQRFSKSYNEKKIKYKKNLDQMDGEINALTTIFVENIEECLAELISADLDKPVDVLPQRQYKIFAKLYVQGVKPAKICLSISTGIANHPDNSVVTSDELSQEPPKDFIESKVLPSLEKALTKRGITIQGNTVESVKYPYEIFISFEQ